jgi:hypothetical protein
MMAGCSGQTSIAREQRSVERFGKGDVDSVIGREIVPQFPDARQKEVVRISVQRNVREVGESRAAADPDRYRGKDRAAWRRLPVGPEGQSAGSTGTWWRSSTIHQPICWGPSTKPPMAITAASPCRLPQGRRLFSDRRYADEPRFLHLAMIGMVETRVERNGTLARERRYYLDAKHGRGQTPGHEPRAKPKRQAQPQVPAKTRQPQSRLPRRFDPPDQAVNLKRFLWLRRPQAANSLFTSLTSSRR